MEQDVNGRLLTAGIGAIEIEEWDCPYHFWGHEHTFEEQAGGTLVRDRVEYKVPGGRLVHALLVRRDLERIFTFRRQVLERQFGS